MLPSGHAHKAPLHRQRHGHGPEADGEHRRLPEKLFLPGFCFLSVSVQEPPFKFIQVNGFNGGCIPKVLLQDRFLLTYSDQGTYGASGFMTDSEMREVLELVPDITGNRGVILGKLYGKAVCLPEKTPDEVQSR